jgi:predicted transcriptional regulator
MTTTTIRIDDTLKARVAAAAERAGKTAHAFILDAIAQTVEQVEFDDAFHRVADERWATVLATGKSVAWDDAKTWLEARSRGESARRPATRTKVASTPVR